MKRNLALFLTMLCIVIFLAVFVYCICRPVKRETARLIAQREAEADVEAGRPENIVAPT